MQPKKSKKQFIEGVSRTGSRAGRTRPTLDPFTKPTKERAPIGVKPSTATGFTVASDSKANVSGAPKFDLELEDVEQKPVKKGWFKRRKDKKKPTSKARRWSKRTALAMMAVLLIGGGWLGWKLYRNAAKLTRDNNPFHLLSALQSAPLKNTDGRTNILLAGNSVDDPGHGGAKLTDSIMVLSIDTKNKTAFMLSIPRDLWVDYQTRGCSVGYQGKINATFVCGDETNFKQDGYPNGGMGLLEKVVEDNFGIDIHYQGLINYGAFKDAVNAVGGITITVESSDPRGLYDPNIAKVDGGPLKLSNGQVTLDGQTALNLARARGDSAYSYGFPGSDFDRTKHQRQMLLAIKEKALSAGVLANPLKLGQLFDTLGKNVQTDLELKEMQSLYEAGKDLNNDNIKSLSLNDWEGKNLLTSYAAPNGSSALAPAAGVGNFSQIKKELKKIISNDQVAQEAANIVILNGSGVNGEAVKQAEVLSGKGMNVLITANADKQYATSVLVDNTAGKKSASLGALQNTYKISASADAALTAKYPSADFVIILGRDAVPQQ